jgi:hypothetical protein
MDLETTLGFILYAGATGVLLYWVFQAVVRQPRETLAEFRRAPLFSICAWLGIVGLLLFVIGLLSMGRLTFEIETPWGYIKSQWVGAVLALLSIPAMLLAPRRRTRRESSQSLSQ